MQAVTVLGLVLLLAAFYEFSVPGPTRALQGVVVTLQQHASKDHRVRRWVVVKLDEGRTISARMDGSVNLRPGDRVGVVEVQGALFGFRWYRFHRHIQPMRSTVESLVERHPRADAEK